MFGSQARYVPLCALLRVAGGQVNVYGFPRTPTMQHYFLKSQAARAIATKPRRMPPEAHHHWSFERFCLRYMRTAGIPGLHIH